MLDVIFHVIKYDFCGGETNTYLFETPHYVVLIDAAGKSIQGIITNVLDRVKLEGKIFLVLNTHGHWDHIASNWYLKDRYRAEILGHREIEKLCDRHRQFDQVYGAFYCGQAEEQAIRSIYMEEFEETALPDRCLEDGDCIEDDLFRLRVLHTPGHTADSISFYEEYTGLLFSGDAVQGNGFDGNAPFYVDAAAYQKSLERMAALNPKGVYCGHGKAEGGSAARVFLHLSMKKAREIDYAVQEALSAGIKDPMVIAGEVARRMDYANSMHIMHTVMAHMKMHGCDPQLR